MSGGFRAGDRSTGSRAHEIPPLSTWRVPGSSYNNHGSAEARIYLAGAQSASTNRRSSIIIALPPSIKTERGAELAFSVNQAYLRSRVPEEERARAVPPSRSRASDGARIAGGRGGQERETAGKRAKKGRTGWTEEREIAGTIAGSREADCVPRNSVRKMNDSPMDTSIRVPLAVAFSIYCRPAIL